MPYSILPFRILRLYGLAIVSQAAGNFLVPPPAMFRS